MSGWGQDSGIGGTTWSYNEPQITSEFKDGGATSGDASGGAFGDSSFVFGDAHGDFGNAGEGGYGAFSGDCYNCGQPGHSKQDCPEPQKSRACFNCGEEGHSKADCTNARVVQEFSGVCRSCDQPGHRAVDCPSAPPRLCKNCGEEGHVILECKNPRKVDRAHVPDVAGEVVWAQLKKASDERDLDDMRDAIEKYAKANRDLTYVKLEQAFRKEGMNFYIIALEKELASTLTNMDLQGNLDRQYTVTYRLSDQHARPKEKELWPTSPEENMERLTNAGEPVDRGIPKCGNCNELGHIAKSCPQEKVENTDRPQVQCYNCQELGHRVRDCPVPREDRFACRNCKESGHSSKDCPKPRDASGVECKNCGEVGHFSRDCPQGGGSGGGACHNCGQEGHRSKDCTNERVLKCRNCDEVGHISKDCPKPRDYSRVKCSNCQQMGHTKIRCKEPPREEIDNDAGGAPQYTAGGNAIESTVDTYNADDAGGDVWAVAGADAVGGSEW